jgi:hypothetical protein
MPPLACSLDAVCVCVSCVHACATLTHRMCSLYRMCSLCVSPTYSIPSPPLPFSLPTSTIFPALLIHVYRSPSRPPFTPPIQHPPPPPMRDTEQAASAHHAKAGRALAGAARDTGVKGSQAERLCDVGEQRLCNARGLRGALAPAHVACISCPRRYHYNRHRRDRRRTRAPTRRRQRLLEGNMRQMKRIAVSDDVLARLGLLHLHALLPARICVIFVCPHPPSSHAPGPESSKFPTPVRPPPPRSAVRPAPESSKGPSMSPVRLRITERSALSSSSGVASATTMDCSAVTAGAGWSSI